MIVVQTIMPEQTALIVVNISMIRNSVSELTAQIAKIHCIIIHFKKDNVPELTALLSVFVYITSQNPTIVPELTATDDYILRQN